MVAIAMTGSVVGFVLGLRFRVMVLLPVEIAALFAAALAVALGDVSWLTALAGLVMFSISSQISYALALTLPLLRRHSTI